MTSYIDNIEQLMNTPERLNDILINTGVDCLYCGMRHFAGNHHAICGKSGRNIGSLIYNALKYAGGYEGDKLIEISRDFCEFKNIILTSLQEYIKGNS